MLYNFVYTQNQKEQILKCKILFANYEGEEEGEGEGEGEEEKEAEA